MNKKPEHRILGKIFLKEYWDSEKELEQLAELDWSDEEETPPPLPSLTNTENKEESSSSNKFLELETPTNKSRLTTHVKPTLEGWNTTMSSLTLMYTTSTEMWLKLHTLPYKRAQTLRPITSPMSLQEEQDEDMGDSQEEKSEIHSELTVTARARVQLAKQDALSDVLVENGFKLRQRISRYIVQASITVPMTALTRPLVEVLYLIPREDAAQIGLYHGQVFMPQYFLKKFMLPTMQL